MCEGDLPVVEGEKQERRSTRSRKKKTGDEEVVAVKKKTELDTMIEKFDSNATNFMKDKKEEIVRIATLFEHNVGSRSGNCPVKGRSVTISAGSPARPKKCLNPT